MNNSTQQSTVENAQRVYREIATDGCATHRYSPAGDDPRLAGE